MESDYRPLRFPIAREALSAALAHVRQCERTYSQACAERARHGASWQARTGLDANVRCLYRSAEQALGALRSAGARALPYRPANGGKATRGAPRQSNTPKGMQWPA